MLEISKDRGICIGCSNKEKPSRQVEINRLKGIYKGDNIVVFNLCNDCLRQLATEFKDLLENDSELKSEENNEN